MPTRKKASFDAGAFLESAGLGNGIVSYGRGAVIFSQGDPSPTVLYVRTGAIRLSVLSPSGKEAIVATLVAGDFLGEAALAGHPVRLVTAVAMSAATVFEIPKRQMIAMLHTQQGLSDSFISYMLSRNSRLESDLIDQLFNSSEKRLARALLLLSHVGTGGKPVKILPMPSQEALAEMVGTTRSRVNVFLNDFRKRGFISYNARRLTINPSLLTVIVHE